CSVWDSSLSAVLF
nr:immunoglobulin light chain junction region [Macaca mulatta]